MVNFSFQSKDKTSLRQIVFIDVFGREMLQKIPDFLKRCRVSERRCVFGLRAAFAVAGWYPIKRALIPSFLFVSTVKFSGWGA
jgi:hypothetical protein